MLGLINRKKKNKSHNALCILFEKNTIIMIIDQNTNFQTKKGGGFKNSYLIDPVTPLHPCRICLSRFSYTYPPTQMILNLCCTKVQIISFISHACVCKKSMIQIYCSC